MYKKVEYRTFRQLLTLREEVQSKWAEKCSGRGSKGDSVIDDDGNFVKSVVGDEVLAQLPLYEVVKKLRERNAEYLLAAPADLVRRLLSLLTDEERGWLSFADHLAYAGVKLPPLQNECFKAATCGGRGHSRLRFAKHVVKLRHARKAMAAEKNGKLCPGAALTEGQYNAYGAAGCADFCKKVTTWYTKSVRKGEVKAGETEPGQIALFLSMLDKLEGEFSKLRKTDVLEYSLELEDALVDLAIGYGEEYGAEHGVRSALSEEFPSTLEHPEHPLSATPFRDVVDMQPNRNHHGDEILAVLGEDVTVRAVGDAYGIDGWLMICLLCCLKHLDIETLNDVGLSHLEEYSTSFYKDNGYHASPSVWSSWVKKEVKPWKHLLYKGGILRR